MMGFLVLIYLVVSSPRVISSNNFNPSRNLQDHCKCHKRPPGPPPFLFYRQASELPAPIPVPVPFSGVPNMSYMPDVPSDIADSISNAAFAHTMTSSGSIPVFPKRLPIIVLPFYTHGFNPYRNTKHFGIKLLKPSHKKRIHDYMMKRDDLSSETGNLNNYDNDDCDPHSSRCKNTQGKKIEEYGIYRRFNNAIARLDLE